MSPLRLAQPGRTPCSLITILLMCALVTLASTQADTNHKDHDDSLHGDHKGPKDVNDHGKSSEGKAGKRQSWSYNIDAKELGPSKWAELYPDACGPVRTNQSPIDILPADAKFVDTLEDIDIISGMGDSLEAEAEPEVKPESEPKSESEAQLNSGSVKHQHDKGSSETKDGGGHKGSGKMFLFNNGHTAQVNVVGGSVYVAGGDLGKEFKVAQFHFHWGQNNTNGSEHRIDGQMFPLEMHIVTYDSGRYATLTEAVGGYNAIAVLGVLFVKGPHNAHLNNVFNSLDKVVQPEGASGQVEIDWVNIRRLLPKSTNRYFRYQGSLTTPTCNEPVKWTVFADHPTICPHQLAKLYALVEGVDSNGETVHLTNNWRPPQPLQKRTVYSSFVPEPAVVQYTEDESGPSHGSHASTADRVYSNSLWLVVAIIGSLRVMLDL